jgi:hypothetical protein
VCVCVLACVLQGFVLSCACLRGVRRRHEGSCSPDRKRVCKSDAVAKGADHAVHREDARSQLLMFILLRRRLPCLPSRALFLALLMIVMFSFMDRPQARRIGINAQAVASLRKQFSKCVTILNGSRPARN